MSETLEQAETRLGDLLGPRWHGPTTMKAGVGVTKFGRIRKAWYENGSLEEVMCRPPGSTTEVIPRTEIWPNKSNPFEVAVPPAPEPDPGEPVTGIVRAMDVSSNQGTTELGPLIAQYQPGHVIVKLYQEAEGPTPEKWSIPQIESAWEHGCTAGGYLWLYHGISVETQVRDALAVAEKAQLNLPILWIDCETYEGEGPSLQEILDACYWSLQLGKRVGIYTGDWYWRDVLGIAPDQTGLWANYPCWFASYNGAEDLDIHSRYWPDEMIVGHQYSGNPIDLSAMLASYTVPV